MVLCTAPFRLSSVIEAAMEIAGPGAAMKRLQVHSTLQALFSSSHVQQASSANLFTASLVRMPYGDLCLQ